VTDTSKGTPEARRPPPAGGTRPPAPRRSARELRRRHLIPAGIAVLVAVLVGGLLLALAGGPDRAGVARRYTDAWARGDYRAMYAELTPAARKRVGAARFAQLHREALATATALRLAPASRPEDTGKDTERVPMVIVTRIFGRVALAAELPVVEAAGAVGVDWRRHLVFPGLRAGEALTRRVSMPPRGTLLSRDGGVLAGGTARTAAPALADVAPDLVGRVGPIPPERRAQLRVLGVPDGTPVGLSGLERALDEQLLGRPGGLLLAGRRTLAASATRAAGRIRTTIAPSVVRAAIGALAGRLGAVVALDPRSGAVLGYAGIAFSGLQPPGSTFKVLTLTGVLEQGLATKRTPFPVQTEATLAGVALQNANGESCGGTLARSFALSCNSVFAPLGAKLGAAKLVAVAERYGFNGAPLLPGAAVAQIPPAAEIGDDLAVGSSAIGQGRVQATALQMAVVAATIAERGRRPALTLDLATVRRRPVAPTVPVTSPRVAATVAELMRGVVTSGTGRSAAIPGVPVAGKTGTAELQSTKTCAVTPPPPLSGLPAPVNPESCSAPSDTTDTDAWFTAFAPSGATRAPRVAVGVLVVRAGAGGDTAAPIARQVMQAALKRG
jgi:penicillin-binding protein A